MLRSLVHGIKEIIDFIIIAFNFLVSTIKGLFQLLDYLANSLTFIPASLQFLPPLIITAVIACVSIAIIKIIVGRNE